MSSELHNDEIQAGAMRVVIVSHGRSDLLKRTLDSIASAELPEVYRGTLVIETGERFGAERVVREFEGTLQAHYLFSESPKKTVALNAAIAECPDEFLVFLDDDVRIAAETLVSYADAAARWGRGSYFGGPTGVDYEVAPPEWLLKFLPASARGITYPADTDVIEYPDYFLGFNWAAFASDLARCGGFSPEFGPGTWSGGGDETFMQFAMNRHGMSGQLVKEAMVWHHVPADRCSPSWVLQRVSKNAFDSGIYEEQVRRARDERLGILRACARPLRRCFRLRDYAKIAVLRPSGVFAVRSRWKYFAGFVRGYWYGKAHRPLESSASDEDRVARSKAPIRDAVGC